MKIQYCSDLHLEFRDNHKWINNHPVEPVGDILILAGDIVPFLYIGKFNAFFDSLADKFKAVYWVPGNHEYYDYNISMRAGSFIEKIRDNVFLINNKTVEIDNTRLIFSTMWSHISPANEQRMENAISDFHLIQNLGKPFTAAAFNKLHQTGLKFIMGELDRKYEGKTIVITHHIPALLHYPKKYAKSDLNEVFAVELTTMINKTKPDYWIYGHHHFNTPDFTIGTTTLLTNQLGYIHHREHISFDREKCISIR